MTSDYWEGNRTILKEPFWTINFQILCAKCHPQFQFCGWVESQQFQVDGICAETLLSRGCQFWLSVRFVLCVCPSGQDEYITSLHHCEVCLYCKLHRGTEASEVQ